MNLRAGLCVVLGPRLCGKSTLIRYVLNLAQDEYVEVLAMSDRKCWMCRNPVPQDNDLCGRCAKLYFSKNDFPLQCEVPREHIRTCSVHELVQFRQKQQQAWGTERFRQHKPTVLVFENGFLYHKHDIEFKQLVQRAHAYNFAIFVSTEHLHQIPWWARGSVTDLLWSLRTERKISLREFAEKYRENDFQGTMLDPVDPCMCHKQEYKWLWGSPSFEKQPQECFARGVPHFRKTVAQRTRLVPPLLDIVQSYLHPYASCQFCSRPIVGTLIEVPVVCNQGPVVCPKVPVVCPRKFGSL